MRSLAGLLTRVLVALTVSMTCGLASCSSSDDDGKSSEPQKCASTNVDCKLACDNLAAMCQTPPSQQVCKIVCQYLDIGNGSTPMERCNNTCLEWRAYTDSWYCNAQTNDCAAFSQCADTCPD